MFACEIREYYKITIYVYIHVVERHIRTSFKLSIFSGNYFIKLEIVEGRIWSKVAVSVLRNEIV